MKKFSILALVFSPLFLTACTNETQAIWDETQVMWEDFSEGFRHNPERASVKVAAGYSGNAQTSFNKEEKKIGKATKKAKLAKIAKTPTIITHQRINTTACNDLDDWYLDGFRVGKSFRSQKSEMFQKRTQYCRGNLPNAYRHYWENGYQIGVKS